MLKPAKAGNAIHHGCTVNDRTTPTITTNPAKAITARSRVILTPLHSSEYIQTKLETQFFDTHDVERQLFVKWLALALAYLAQEIFLEADLGHVDPFAFRRPVHVAWRELWLSDEGDTAIAEIRKADGVPACFGCRLLAFENCSEVKGGCRHHTFDHEAGFRHADRYGGRTCGRYGDTYAEREDFREGRIALMLVNDDEAARIGQPFDIANGGHSPES